MQIFQKQNATLSGVEHVLELFKFCTGYHEGEKWIDKSSQLSIETLSDGDQVGPRETIMHITGPYAYFAHLESLYLGILARQTKIATNVKKVMNAAGDKQVIFFADRFDYFLNQEIDGYAAKIGGVTGVATAAQSFLWQGKPMGTIPHSLIAINNGDTVKAAEQFSKNFPDIPLITLVDFENDCVKTSLEVARRFGKKLFAVRLDTSEAIVDASLQKTQSTQQSRTSDSQIIRQSDTLSSPSVLKGVTSQLVRNVRQALDSEGFEFVKIVVSGGFDAEKIERFEKENVPVDMYGVGSSLLRGNIDFTADIVKVDGENMAKTGRSFSPNNKLCNKQI